MEDYIEEFIPEILDVLDTENEKRLGVGENNWKAGEIGDWLQESADWLTGVVDGSKNMDCYAEDRLGERKVLLDKAFLGWVRDRDLSGNMLFGLYMQGADMVECWAYYYVTYLLRATEVLERIEDMLHHNRVDEKHTKELIEMCKGYYTKEWEYYANLKQ